VGLANLGSESETCVGSRVHLVGVSISVEKNFYRLPFTPPSLVRRIGPSITLGEVVVPTSPAEAPPASTARGGVSTLESATGGEVALPSAAPRGGVAVRASSPNASPTTFGSTDLVRDGEAGAPRSSCGTTTGLHINNTSKQEFNSKQKRIEPSILYLVTTGMRSLGLNS
jgi:hypothetical protein